MTDLAPIRLFVGASANWDDAESEIVLEHSLEVNSSRPVEIVWMRASRDPLSSWGCWDMQKWSTPFSGFRWAIPEFCNYKGRAIYVDNDFVFLGDIAELWETPIGKNKVCAAKSADRFDIVVWDCEAAGYHIRTINELKEDPDSHERLKTYFSLRPELVEVIDRKWNCFDGENDEFKWESDEWIDEDHMYISPSKLITQVKGLHYTDMSTNPGVRMADKRLEKEKNMRHWYDGPRRKHRRPEVEVVFYSYLETAHIAGYHEEDYYPLAPYGDMVKQSQKNYKANNGWDVTKGQ